MRRRYVRFLRSLWRGDLDLYWWRGLGPTRDDRTMDTISGLTHRETVIDEAIAKASERRGVSKEDLPPHHQRMARTISGATAYLNPVGVSPSTVLRVDDAEIVAMPGPPREVHAIFDTYIAGLIGAESKRRSYSKRIVIGIVESEFEPLIDQVVARFRDIYMKPLISQLYREC
ncbi:MAG: molybdopterin-binding protein [Candidatus Bathyarchaeia archaeon]